MPTQITIIGLGQIGGSIGMALEDKKASIHRVGFDKDAGVAKAAESLGVVDEIKGLIPAVREADIVMLCLPLGELRATLQKIGFQLKKNTVVMDTAPVKSSMIEWTKSSPACRALLYWTCTGGDQPKHWPRLKPDLKLPALTY